MSIYSCLNNGHHQFAIMENVLFKRSQTHLRFTVYGQVIQANLILKIVIQEQDIKRSKIKGDDTKFWEYEWMKHGTCSLNKFTQEEYFQLALNMNQNLNMLNLLRNSGIVPTIIKTYHKLVIIRAIKKGIQNVELAGIVCIRGTSIVQEIRMCFEPDGIKYKNCPTAIRSSPSCTTNDITLLV